MTRIAISAYAISVILTFSSVSSIASESVRECKYDKMFHSPWPWRSGVVDEKEISHEVIHRCKGDYEQSSPHQLVLYHVYRHPEYPDMHMYLFEVKTVTDIYVGYAVDKKSGALRFRFEMWMA